MKGSLKQILRYAIMEFTISFKLGIDRKLPVMLLPLKDVS